MTPDDIALAEEVADRLWTTLEHRRAEAELRANEDRLAFLLQLNDALRPLTDSAAVQDTAARLLGEHLRVARVAYADYESDRTYVVRHEYANGVEPLAGSPPRTPVGGAIGEALHRADPVILGLSTHARSEAGQAFEQAGAADFFVKGTDTERLIEHLLHVHAVRRALGTRS